MNSTKRKICLIVLTVMLLAIALSTLSACKLPDLNKAKNVHKDGLYYTVYALKRYVILHGFDVKDGTQVYEIPSRIKHGAVRYPVTSFSPSNHDHSFYTFDIVKGGNAKELIVPKTVEKLDIFSYNGKQQDSLEKITVDEGNPYFTDIDGVVYTKDQTTLVYYPPAKVSERLTIPQATTKLKDSLGIKTQLSYISVAAGNTAFSAKDGVLLNADGSAIVCYPQNKQDETYTIPSTLAVLSESHLISNKYLKYFEVEQGNSSFSAYKGNVYSQDGSILLYRQYHEDVNVLDLPDTVKILSNGTLAGIKCLYVPKGLERIVFNKYGYSYDYYDENSENPISKVDYLFFEGDEIPFCLRYAELTENVRFGVTRQEFEQFEQQFNKGE